MSITCIKSSSEVMEWLHKQKQKPDLILIHLNMLHSGDYTLARMLKENNRYRTIKLIAVIADPIPGTAEKFKEIGFDAYLAKPIIKNDLLGVIQTTLGDKRDQGQIITRHIYEELSLKGLKVLVAEDNAFNRKLISILLNNLGCKVETAVNGKEALKLLKAKTCDLCLMDIQMPVMGGIETAKEIRKQISKDIPIIALTASILAGDDKRFINAGMNDYLPKPVDPIKLKEKIRKLVR